MGRIKVMTAPAEQFPEDSGTVNFKAGSPEYEEIKRRVAEIDREFGFPDKRKEVLSQPPREKESYGAFGGEGRERTGAEILENAKGNMQTINLDEALHDLTVDKITKFLGLDNLTEHEAEELARVIKARGEVKKAYEGNQEVGQ